MRKRALQHVGRPCRRSNGVQLALSAAQARVAAALRQLESAQATHDKNVAYVRRKAAENTELAREMTALEEDIASSQSEAVAERDALRLQVADIRAGQANQVQHLHDVQQQVKRAQAAVAAAEQRRDVAAKAAEQLRDVLMASNADNSIETYVAKSNALRHHLRYLRDVNMGLRHGLTVKQEQRTAMRRQLFEEVQFYKMSRMLLVDYTSVGVEFPADGLPPGAPRLPRPAERNVARVVRALLDRSFRRRLDIETEAERIKDSKLPLTPKVQSRKAILKASASSRGHGQLVKSGEFMCMIDGYMRANHIGTKHMFLQFDKDKDGMLGADELRRAMEQMVNVRISNRELDALMLAVTQDDDAIGPNIVEFLEAMRQARRVGLKSLADEEEMQNEHIEGAKVALQAVLAFSRGTGSPKGAAGGFFEQ